MVDEETRFDESGNAGQRQVDDMTFSEIGERLRDLGHQLIAIADNTDGKNIRMELDHLDRRDNPFDAMEADRISTLAIRSTLTGLGAFRRDYANWERLVVEFALTHHGITQRDAARLLGVGLSTVNRWAQHPLTYED